MFVAAILVGPGPTGVVAFAGAFLARALDPQPWYKQLFNASLYAISGVAASAVFYVIVGPPDAAKIVEQLPAAVAGAITAFAVNHVLVVGVIAIDSGRSMRAIWDEKFRWFVPHYFALVVTGYATAMGYLALGPAGAAVFILPGVMLWFGVRQYIERTRRDAEELQHANLALARNEERFRSLVQHAPGLIAVLNLDGGIEYVNPPGVVEAVGHSGDDPGYFESLVHRDDRGRVREVIERAVREPRGDHSLELKILAEQRTWRDYEAVVTNLIDNASVAGIVINARDVTERKELENQLRHEAFHDPLHQPSEPRALHGAAAIRSGAGGVGRRSRSGALFGPRSLQGGQRQPRSQCRRRAAGRARRAAARDRRRAGDGRTLRR